MTPGGPQGGLTRGDIEGVIAYAIGDALFLKRELEKHAAVPRELREAMTAAAMPALITLEAEQAKAARAGTA